MCNTLVVSSIKIGQLIMTLYNPSVRKKGLFYDSNVLQIKKYTASKSHFGMGEN